MKFAKVLAAGLTATVLVMSPLSSYLVKENKLVYASSPYPQEIQLESIKGKNDYGGDAEQYKINLGKRTGTLILKLRTTDKWATQVANNLYVSTEKSRVGNFYLTDKPTAFANSEGKAIYMFDGYATIFDEVPELKPKYKTGFSDVGVGTRNGRFIALGINVDAVKNNGVFYINTPGMTDGYWDVSAYFYDGVNVEKQSFNEVNRYFPLLGKVWWDGIELKPGQIGRLTVLKDTPLYKLEGEKKVYSRTLKAGEFYRIYAFKPGKLSVGGGYYVDRDEKVQYQTPSKTKLKLTQSRF